MLKATEQVLETNQIELLVVLASSSFGTVPITVETVLQVVV